MPTQPYKNSKGERLPSVTQCLSVLAKPAVIHWAWQLGIEGLDYRKVKDDASNTGTLVHDLILNDLSGTKPDLSRWTKDQIRSTDASWIKWNEWREKHKVEPILLEAALISNEYQYGGTFDFFGRIDDEVVLADFKTSKALYVENFCQLAAYEQLVWECGKMVNTAKKPLSLRVIRVGKENGGELKEYVLPREDVEKYWNMFLATKTIYEINKSAKLPK